MFRKFHGRFHVLFVKKKKEEKHSRSRSSKKTRTQALENVSSRKREERICYVCNDRVLCTFFFFNFTLSKT